MPDTIQFRDGHQIINRYDASGQKLQTEYFTLSTPLVVPLSAGETAGDTPGQVLINGMGYYRGTKYAGNIEYAAVDVFPRVYEYIADKIYNPEGYTSHYDYNGYYYRKDHLGNIREVWQGGRNRTLQRTQYYPSGLPWAEGEGADVQQKKYNGKEWIEAHGLDEYDSQARMYYPAIMRTTTMDPLAEKYYHISPYAYCGNNPVNAVDLQGDSITIVHRTGFLGLGGKETLTYESGNLYNADGSAYSGKVKGYLKSVMGALGNLNATAEGASLVSELQNSTNMFTIKSGDNGFVPNSSTKAGANLSEVQAVTGNTAGSTGSGGTIYWNANSTSGGLDLTGSISRPAYIGLGHELGHASDSNQGLLHFSSDYTNALGATYFSTHNGLLKSEWRAVYRENLIRGQAGISLRTHYGYDITTGVPRPIGPRLLTPLNLPINYR